MILPITQLGDPILRKRCREVSEVTEDILTLKDDMIETMHDANGVGLAAPQVGIDLRMAVVDVSHDPDCVSLLRVNGEDVSIAEIMPLVFINPDFTKGGSRERMEEGCLSIQDVRADVHRPGMVDGVFPQLDGSKLHIETDGLLARVIQHETDHLNGVLFVDRVSAASKLMIRRELKRLRAQGQ